MKKIVAVCVIGLALCVSGAFAQHSNGFGIGVQGGYSSGIGGGLTLHIPSIPIFWTIDVNSSWLGVAGDYYLFDSSLVKEVGLGWYLGVGGFVDLGFWDRDHVLIAAGARLPIGLSWQPIKLLEIYLQVVPSLGLQISPDVRFWNDWWGANLGLRFWLS
ncbi:hypothetical protein FACS1894151_05980 [Spirochaetia bacterium]|nr:hypothetical protein FACS1894151_05980 [Spirochaetia bacterium]